VKEKRSSKHPIFSSPSEKESIGWLHFQNVEEKFPKKKGKNSKWMVDTFLPRKRKFVKKN
jgi:hypothetical protein